MKILLVAVNARYIHTNPAVRSLAAYAERSFRESGRTAPQIEIAEYTINQRAADILADIYQRRPDVIMFSCYIWNVRMIRELTADAASVMPDADIWLGGPEVSFEAEQMLAETAGVRGIMIGEGEETFLQLAELYAAAGKNDDITDEQLSAVRGIVFCSTEPGAGCRAVTTPPAPLMRIDDLPFTYDGAEKSQHRIIYYESSRGCPFRCAYCLSSVDKSVRFRALDTVKAELKTFLDDGVPQVKFVDRTFNCDSERALEIWRFLRDNDNGTTNFHFEIGADLLTEKQLEVLRDMRPGQVQFEIGVQSVNSRTLAAIDRPADIERIRENVAAVKAGGNIHIHLDLIAGLPYEDYDSFADSFDDVYRMEPEQLQLGFLKVLKGTPMRRRTAEYGMKYAAEPPYEVLETSWMSYGELIKLRRIEEMGAIYHNSGQFTASLAFLCERSGSPFRLFEGLAAWYGETQPAMVSFSREKRYEILLEFAKDRLKPGDAETFREKLIFDFYMRDNRKTRPAFLGDDRVGKDFAKAFYSREAAEHRYLAGGRYDTEDPRLLRRLTHLERRGERYYLFDYEKRDPMSGNAKVTEVFL